MATYNVHSTCVQAQSPEQIITIARHPSRHCYTNCWWVDVETSRSCRLSSERSIYCVYHTSITSSDSAVRFSLDPNRLSKRRLFLSLPPLLQFS